MDRPRVMVIGSSNTDMVVKAPRLPVGGETVTGTNFVMAAGGKGANQAVAAARLGAEVAFLARLGPDMFGDQALDGYRREGIRTELIVRDARQHTGVALIIVDDEGENLIAVAPGANLRLKPEDVDRAAGHLRAAQVLLLQLEVPLETVRRAVLLANASGVPVVLDPAPAPDQPLDQELLSGVTYLTPNETEAQRLTGIEVVDEDSARAAAARLLELGARHVIVTLGAKGALVADREQALLVPARRVEAQDSTAAGDAFNGGLAVALARGLDLADAVREACLVATLSTTRLGAQPSLPTGEELDAFRTES